MSLADLRQQMRDLRRQIRDLLHACWYVEANGAGVHLSVYSTHENARRALMERCPRDPRKRADFILAVEEEVIRVASNELEISRLEAELEQIDEIHRKCELKPTKASYVTQRT